MPRHLPRNYERFILTADQVREDGVGPTPEEINRIALEGAARADARDENREIQIVEVGDGNEEIQIVEVGERPIERSSNRRRSVRRRRRSEN